MKHTPGNWETGKNKNGSFATCVFGKDFWLQVHANAASPFTEESTLEANARLIAAAPELLEALKKCRSIILRDPYGSGDVSEEVIDNAIELSYQAIAKAESK